MSEWQVIEGDCLERMREFPDGYFDCIVTSPPYWGLRDYGTAEWVGGAPNCDHRQATIRKRRRLAEAANACDGGNRKAEDRSDADALGLPYRDVCGKCGAVRVDKQLGLEPTPEEYVAHMVAVFREARRVLAPHGVCWVNLGDSYTSGGRDTHGTRVGYKQQTNRGMSGENDPARAPQPPGLKPKDLCGIPWRVAFALQADGWWLRSDVVWAKGWSFCPDRAGNPMPESVGDRPVRAHEYVFMLTKTDDVLGWCHEDGRGSSTRPEPDRVWRDAKRGIDRPVRNQQKRNSKRSSWRLVNKWRGQRYWYDALAVREQAAAETVTRLQQNSLDTQEGGYKQELYAEDFPGRKRRDRKPADILKHMRDNDGGQTRSLRDVWAINTRGYAEAHFAVFPEELVEPMIRAGCPPQVCAECGKPWVRVVEKVRKPRGDSMGRRDVGDFDHGQAGSPYMQVIGAETLGWQPTCSCPPGTPTRPGRVLDPFGGSGTVAVVAMREGRDSVLLELNPTYAEMARARIARWHVKPKRTVQQEPEEQARMEFEEVAG